MADVQFRRINGRIVPIRTSKGSKAGGVSRRIEIARKKRETRRKNAEAKRADKLTGVGFGIAGSAGLAQRFGIAAAKKVSRNADKALDLALKTGNEKKAKTLLKTSTVLSKRALKIIGQSRNIGLAGLATGAWLISEGLTVRGEQSLPELKGNEDFRKLGIAVGGAAAGGAAALALGRFGLRSKANQMARILAKKASKVKKRR